MPTTALQHNNSRIITAIRRRANIAVQLHGLDLNAIRQDLTDFLVSLVALDVLDDYIVTPMNAKYTIDIAFKPIPTASFIYFSIVFSKVESYDEMTEDLARSLGY
jgi:hypothetical protein